MTIPPSFSEMNGYLKKVSEDIFLETVAEWMADHPSAPVVGYLPAYAPRELIYAAGGLAVGIWGGGAGVEIVQGDAFYQSYICHLPRSVIELAVMGTYGKFSGIIFPSVCDVIRNLSGMWQVLFPGQWTKYLDLPQNFDMRSGGTFYRHELMDLATRILGHLPDEPYRECLHDAIALTNRQRDVMMGIDRLRSAFPERVPFDEYYALLRSALILHPEDHIRCAEMYLQEAAMQEGKPLDHVRVVLIGAFCEQPPVGLLRTIEKSGCYIVNHDLLLGLHLFTEPITDQGDDPFISLAEAYMAGTRMAPFKYQAERNRGEELIALVREARADGVIFAAPSFCDPALLERPYLLKALEKARIPAISMKYSENACPYGEIREQVGTFSDAIRLWGEEIA